MKTLQLGCGIRPIPGAVNHDLNKHAPFVDVAHDLDLFPWPWADGEFERVIALDVMEHLRCEVSQWLDECWRILKPGGLLVLRLPAWDHENSHIDPTHRRLFHPRTFEYWDTRTDLHKTYGAYYYQKSSRWWVIKSVERTEQGANIAYVLRKPGTPTPATMQETFSGIYKRDQWGNGSGPGSRPDFVRPYVEYLEQFIKDHGMQSIVDVGCGDWQFMRDVDLNGAAYLGVDVVPEVIEANVKAYGERFLCADASTAELPAADLLIVKDILQHWSNADIAAFLAILPRYKYALITNCFAAFNRDIATGDYRGINLTAEPFNLPASIALEFGRPVWNKVTYLWQRGAL